MFLSINDSLLIVSVISVFAIFVMMIEIGVLIDENHKLKYEIKKLKKNIPKPKN